MRFSWWRDIIGSLPARRGARAAESATPPAGQGDPTGGLYDREAATAVQAHPVASALREAVIDRGITRAWLSKILEARYDDCMRDQVSVARMPCLVPVCLCLSSWTPRCSILSCIFVLTVTVGVSLSATPCPSPLCHLEYVPFAAG